MSPVPSTQRHTAGDRVKVEGAGLGSGPMQYSTHSVLAEVEVKFLTESTVAFFGGTCYVQFWAFLSCFYRK